MNEPGTIESSGGRQVITDASTAASTELRSRQIRYNITMAFRTACFIGMLFAPDPFRWVLFGAAVVLPYIAMIAGSQVDRRTRRQEFVPSADVRSELRGLTDRDHRPDHRAGGGDE